MMESVDGILITFVTRPGIPGMPSRSPSGTHPSRLGEEEIFASQVPPPTTTTEGGPLAKTRTWESAGFWRRPKYLTGWLISVMIFSIWCRERACGGRGGSKLRWTSEHLKHQLYRPCSRYVLKCAEVCLSSLLANGCRELSLFGLR